MGAVHAVLAKFLDVCPYLPVVAIGERSPLVGTILRQSRDPPLGRSAGRIVVNHDQPVYFVNQPGSDTRGCWNFVAVRNAGAGSISGKTPSVKRALQCAAEHLAAVAEMRSDVR